MTEGTSRSEALRVAHQRKMDAAFAGKTFTIVRELTMPEGQVFQATFGRNGRHGYILRDDATGQLHVVGDTIAGQIADNYKGVTLPPRGHKT